MFAFSDGMHRQIFMDGRSLEPDPNPTGWVIRSGAGKVTCWWLKAMDTTIARGSISAATRIRGLRITERYTRRDIGRMDVQVTMVDSGDLRQADHIHDADRAPTDTEMLEGFCENTTRAASGWCRRRLLTSCRCRRLALARYMGTYDTVNDGRKHFVT